MTETPHITLEDAREVGTTVGVNWDSCGFSVETFQAGMNVEYQRALRTTELDASDTIACAQRVSAHLFDFPNYYTQQDMLEAAYDEYWAERTDWLSN
jgi:hypothetical protein